MGAGSWESHHAITSLMFRYAECVDAADFDGVAALFEHGKITNEGVAGAIAGPDAVRQLYVQTTRVHSDGTTRTRHVNSNVLVDIDDDEQRASARSSFVVFQQTRELPLQPVVSGRYRDAFLRTDGAWHFDTRHIVVDLVGDVREHLTFDLTRIVEH